MRSFLPGRYVAEGLLDEDSNKDLASAFVSEMEEAVLTLVNLTLVNPTHVNPTLVNPTLVNPTLVNPTLVNLTLV